MYKIEKLGTDNILHNKYGLYSKKELESQLKKGHLTIKELGEIYSLKKFQMVHVLKSLAISYRNKLNDTRILSPIITEEMHQVLLGSLLGDAYMKEPKSYMLSHGINQMEYFYHIANFMAPFIASIGYKKIKTGKFFYLWTYRHDIFKPYFNRFYSHGKSKKYLTIESIHDLNALGLAIWYMDDGKYNSYGAYLCVGNVSSKEGSILIKFLKDRFNLEATFQNQNKNKGYFNIYIKAESRSHFFELIEPFIVPSMRYKLYGESPPFVNFSIEKILIKHKNICKKAQRFISFSGIKKINKKNSGIIDLKDSYKIKIQEDIKNNKQISYSLNKII